MPRQERRKSATGIYHVMLRGINKQVIFEDEEDNEKFLSILLECKAISEYKVFAYCLMSNHAHLLIKEEFEGLGTIFKRIGGRYVYWYNSKYKRNGHLFQDRFKSEIVEKEDYLMTVIRYIHQNPIKAGLVKEAKDYAYSSYREYVNPQENQLSDIDFVFDFVGREGFVKYHEALNTDKCLEIGESNFRMTDEQAKGAITRISKCNSSSEFQNLDMTVRMECLKLLKEEGISIRQLSRLTGISFGIVRKA